MIGVRGMTRTGATVVAAAVSRPRSAMGLHRPVPPGREPRARTFADNPHRPGRETGVVPPEGRGRAERKCDRLRPMKRPILAAIALAVAAAPATASAASIDLASPNGSQVIAYKADP